jgi:hypothetical protein
MKFGPGSGIITAPCYEHISTTPAPPTPAVLEHSGHHQHHAWGSKPAGGKHDEGGVCDPCAVSTGNGPLFQFGVLMAMCVLGLQGTGLPGVAGISCKMHLTVAMWEFDASCGAVCIMCVLGLRHRLFGLRDRA